jgi:hypothetical protein
MNAPGASEAYIAARRALLDALDALAVHLDALVLVGAQAVYVHTGEADVAVATHTTDGDLVVNPDGLSGDPLLEEAMQKAGFVLDLGRIQPGEWISRDGIAVDLLVPEALGGPGRRGARIPPHDKMSARKVTGLEAAVVDNEIREIIALDGLDQRRYDLAVAGPTALLVAKLHKLGDRQKQGTRLEDKDAHDVYRLLRAVPTALFADKVRFLRDDPIAGDVTREAVERLEALFGTAESLGSTMAGRAEVLVGDPEVTAAASSALALDILGAVATGNA